MILDPVAFLIFLAYVVVSVGLWWYREEMKTIELDEIGWFLVPIFGSWILFYGALSFFEPPFDWLVWWSRVAHFHSLSLGTVLVVRCHVLRRRRTWSS